MTTAQNTGWTSNKLTMRNAYYYNCEFYNLFFFNFFQFVFFVDKPSFYKDLKFIKSSSYPMLITVHPQIPEWVCQYRKQNWILHGLIKLKKDLESKSNGKIFFGDYCILFLFLSFFLFIYFFFFQAIIKLL